MKFLGGERLAALEGDAKNGLRALTFAWVGVGVFFVLSGYLIGMELAGARPYWLGRDIVMIGARRMTEAYVAALRLGGLAPRIHDATEMTLAGLAAAHRQLLVERQHQ